MNITYSRDVPSIFNSTKILVKTICFLSETLTVSLVLPSEKGEYRTSIINYDRIKEDFNIYTFKEIMMAKFRKYLANIKVFDYGDYFTYQYKDLPTLFILKSDGKIYARENSDMAQMSAFRLLRALVKFGQVEGYRRIQYEKKPMNKYEKSIRGWVNNG